MIMIDVFNKVVRLQTLRHFHDLELHFSRHISRQQHYLCCSEPTDMCAILYDADLL